MVNFLKKIAEFISVILSILFIVSGVIAVMVVAGFMPELLKYPIWVWIVFPGIAGFLAVVLTLRSIEALKYGVITGLANMSMVVYSWIYFNVFFPSRTSFMKIELVLPALLGIATGVLINKLLPKSKPDIKEESN